MKNLLNELGLSLQDIAHLLSLPKSTVQGWIEKNAGVPSAYQPYFQALKAYQQTYPRPGLEKVQQQFDQTLIAEEQRYIEETLKKLKHKLTTYQLALTTLQQNRQYHLRQWQLSQSLEPYFSASLQREPVVQDWLKALERKSHYHLRRPAIAQEYRRLRHKIAGLEAEITFLERELT